MDGEEGFRFYTRQSWVFTENEIICCAALLEQARVRVKKCTKFLHRYILFVVHLDSDYSLSACTLHCIQAWLNELKCLLASFTDSSKHSNIQKIWALIFIYTRSLLPFILELLLHLHLLEPNWIASFIIEAYQVKSSLHVIRMYAFFK